MKTLRPYQNDAFQTICAAHEEGKSSALIVMATGLGKMVITAQHAKWWLENKNTRILFLAHMTDVLYQARDREFSDAIGTDVQTGMLNGSDRQHLDAPIVFATFQSMRMQKTGFTRDAFGLVIVDEAHHAQATTYREVIEYFEPELLLGYTATPKRSDGLETEELFGEVVYEYSLEKALAVGKWLAAVDYRLMIDHTSQEELQKLLKRVQKGERQISIDEIDRTVFLPERTDVIVKKIREAQGENKSTIVFCSSVAHLRSIHKKLDILKSSI